MSKTYVNSGAVVQLANFSSVKQMLQPIYNALLKPNPTVKEKAEAMHSLLHVQVLFAEAEEKGNAPKVQG